MTAAALALPVCSAPESLSLRGRRWSVPEINPVAVRALVAAGAPEAVAPVLAVRGVAPAASADFLTPTLKGLLPDPRSFKGMDEATARLEKAVTAGERVTVYGDYDVDGATSTAVMVRFLRMLGVEAGIYIPDRITEGYGPNGPAIERLAAEGTRLIVFVDSGIVSFDPLARAAELGVDCIIIDHHAAEAALPIAAAVVNPNRLDQEPGHGHMCAAGVAFLVCVGLNARLRDAGWLAERSLKPDLMSLLDVVALGTVADVVPLTTINRALVRRGLEVIRQRRNPGINALIAVAKIKKDVTAGTIGFVLGPRINAGGRVGRSGAGAELLTCDDPARCQEIAQDLDRWNTERKSIEAECLVGAKAAVEAAGGPGPVVIAVGDGFHEGVIGIVASRLKDAYDRPAFCFSVDAGTGLAKGSARSPRGFDVGAAIAEARKRGILVKGGGHPAAGGVTIEAARIPEFEALLAELVAASGFAGTGVVTEVDLVLPAELVTLHLAEAMASLEPYGQGNPTPRILMPDAQVLSADRVGADGVKLRVSMGARGALECLSWGIADTPFGKELLGTRGKRLDLVGSIKISDYNGRHAEISIEDARSV